MLVGLFFFQIWCSFEPTSTWMKHKGGKSRDDGYSDPMRIESWSPIDLTENHLMSLLITEVFLLESSICKTFLNTLDLPIEQKMELWWWNIGDVQVWFQVPQTERGLPYVFPPSYTYDLCLCWIMDSDKHKRYHIIFILYTVLKQVLGFNFDASDLLRFCPSDGRQSLRDPSAEFGASGGAMNGGYA